MSYEVLEHPADIGFRATAGSLPELFAEAAAALLGIAFESGDVVARQEYALEAEGGDYESLLVNFLNEVLYWVDGKRVAFARFEIRALSPDRIETVAFGEPRDPARHPAKVIVKAVTYHQLRLQETPAGWVAEVYLDI
jgi:SHS2 domain-containing protein